MTAKRCWTSPSGAGQLLALLPQWGLRPHEWVQADPEAAQRLAVYWDARNRYLDAGRSVRPVADPAQMLAQVREPLLQVLRISPDFRPANDPLLRLAGALARSDPDGARSAGRTAADPAGAARSGHGAGAARNNGAVTDRQLKISEQTEN